MGEKARVRANERERERERERESIGSVFETEGQSDMLRDEQAERWRIDITLVTFLIKSWVVFCFYFLSFFAQWL